MNPDQPTASPAPAPPSRWRFSLRSLLIAVAVVSVGLAWARYQFGWWQPPRAPRHSLELLEAARKMYEVDSMRWSVGTATVEQCLASADRLGDAERQACTTVDEELGVLRKHVERMRELRRRCYDDTAPAGKYFFELARWKLAQVAGAGPLEREREELARLQGRWRVDQVQPSDATIAMSFDTRIGAIVWIDRDVYSVAVPQQSAPVKFNVELFLDQSPPGIDLWYHGGDVSSSAAGVYELEDDRMELCFNSPPTDRPSTLASAGGSAEVTIILRRLPANDDPSGNRPRPSPAPAELRK